MIEYEVAERSGDYVLLRLRGELLGDLPVRQLHDVLEDHYVDDGVRLIRVDLSQVKRISLEGVAVLVDLWRESQRRGKRFHAEQARGVVREKLATTGVLRLLSEGD
ncbi:MAG TPA: STAS domain-containing protein [Actinomycetota bacterium]|nr:STAS domain-containing protein [Actinomycetota bacterium]